MSFDWNDQSWVCACGERTTVTHWRHGADGVMFHAGPDAPPSDAVAASIVENFDSDGRLDDE